MNITFIHRGGTDMASYRYRAQIPAEQIGATINQTEADIAVFSKPMLGDDLLADRMKANGTKIIVDFCDDHFDNPLYRYMLGIADKVTCASEEMRSVIYQNGYDSEVIPDPYEFEGEPHANGENLLWFGHQSNIGEIIPFIEHGLNVSCVTGENKHLTGYIPWSLENLQRELTNSNIVIIPDGKKTRSLNRCINAISAGCFVVAGKQHKELEQIIWSNKSIIAGVQFSKCFKDELNDMVKAAQGYVRKNYSQEVIGDKWREVCQ